MRSRRVVVAVVASLGLLAPACGGDEPTRTTVAVDTTSASTPATVAPEEPATCTPPDGRVPLDASDLGNDRDWDVVSFDGTVIRAHWFPVAGASAEAPAPTVLMGPGWASAGDVEVDGRGTAGTVSIGALLDAGYNVLTWDPRGFGESGGEAQIDSPEFEGRDIQQLIDFVGSRPEAQLDVAGDPRLGMVGASYGGGAQFIAAGTDCRVDAIVPIIAWNSLGTSLFKGDVPKLGWANFLLLAAQFGGGRLDPTIPRAAATANSSGTFTAADAQWFIERGPADVVDDISAPTLIIQGTVDGLFTLDEAVANYTTLREAGTEVAMLWYCGGHGICLTDEGDTELVAAAAIAWLDRHVRGDAGAAPVAGFATLDQFGTLHSADEFPADAATSLVASGSGTLQLVEAGGSGPATAGADGGFDITAGVILAITPGRAANAVNVPVPAPTAETFVLGAPMLSLTYSGTVPAGERPTAVFAQLVDDTTGSVVGNQITPIPLVLDGAEQTLQIPIETVAHLLRPGSSLTLQLVATTVAYAQPRLGGSVEFTDITITLPVTTDLRPAA